MSQVYEYVAIDFETANHNLSSACSIGIVCVANNKIVKTLHYLINPKQPFSETNYLIHGISSNDVINEPTFDELWDELFDIFNNNVLVAHNAVFDIGVLKALILQYSLKIPAIKIACTLKISRAAYKGVLYNHKLSTISSYLGVEHDHHDALSDAKVCYHLIERVKRMYQVYTLFELLQELDLSFDYLNFIKKSYYKKTSYNYSKKSNLLKGKTVFICGSSKKTLKASIINLITNCGAIYTKEITKDLTTCIILENIAHQKLDLIKNLGIDICYYTEKEFMELISEKHLKNKQ